MDPSARMSLDPGAFSRNFVKAGYLNHGADGEITKYRHRQRRDMVVAVKAPQRASSRQKAALENEIECLKPVACDQIVTLFGYDRHWSPYAPALFYEFCEFGDAQGYFVKLRELRRCCPEVTLWKFFADIAKGLHYLHDRGLVHTDLKVENVLVCRPKGCTDELPVLPSFKLGDFSRATYLSTNARWAGTYEYAPPKQEQDGRLTPAVDIWGLGATLQAIALDILPIQSQEAFIRDYREARGVDLTGRIDFLEPRVRAQVPCVFRPLNATKTEQYTMWDWPDPRRPVQRYSDGLNRWYEMCMIENPDRRITAKDLVRNMVPVAERQMAIWKHNEKVMKATEKLRREQGNLDGYRRPPSIPPRNPRRHGSSEFSHQAPRGGFQKMFDRYFGAIPGRDSA